VVFANGTPPTSIFITRAYANGCVDAIGKDDKVTSEVVEARRGRKAVNVKLA
jgi:hypothetical protein